jgi:TRAP-type C4-dicarboxylate transport system permease small subunit
MTRILSTQPDEPGSSTSGRDLGARIRNAWQLSKPRDIPIEAASMSGHPRQGPIERLQELLAGIAFVATFTSIVVEVFFRYVLDRPQVWSLELPTYFFLWSFSLAAGLSDWRDDQIGFDLIAQQLPRRIRLAAAALANIVIVVPLAAVLPGTLSYLSLVAQQPNTGLPGTQIWGYAGVILLFSIAAILRARLLILQVRELVRLIRLHHEIAP